MLNVTVKVDVCFGDKTVIEQINSLIDLANEIEKRNPNAIINIEIEQ